MDKLNKAVNSLDNELWNSPKFKIPTIRETALKRASEMAFALRDKKHEEEQRHIIAIKRLERQQSTIHATILLLNGSVGFLRCSQGWNNIQSGFTAFEEIFSDVLSPMVDVSLDRMSIPFGMELWFVDSKGMMTMVDAIRDSSD